MAKLTKDELIKQVEEMSVLELSDLVKALEEKFGVSAAMAVAQPTSAASDAASGEIKEEQTVFNVVVVSSGANKIQVIKALRELVPTLGLKEAKDMVDAAAAAPQMVKEGAKKEEAEDLKKKFEAAGAKVELK